MALPPAGLEYDDIPLELVKTNVFTLRPVYSDDNVDILWVHALIDIVCCFNPAATTSEGPIGGGNVAPQSIADLYRRLMTPRKRLIYRVGSTTIIDVPTLVPGAGDQRYRTDAHNGPKPIDMQVMPFMGERTAMVRYKIETFIPVCTEDDAASLGAVSHRWEMTAELDHRYMERRITIGQAHFRSDYLDRLSLYPDQFRPRLIHPLNPGFKRESVRFSPSEDGASIRYTIVDQEQNFQLEERSGIANISASYTYGYTGAVGTGLNPTAYQQLHLVVEGEKDSTIENMVSRGVKAATQLSFHPDNKFLMTEARATYDYHRHTMHLFFALIANGLLGQATALIKPTLGAGAGDWPKKLDGLGRTREEGPLVATGPPTIYGGRDTEHRIVLAQALGIECEVPGAPFNPLRKAKDKFTPQEE